MDGHHAGKEVGGKEVASRLIGGDVAGVGLQLDLSELGYVASFWIDSEGENAAVARRPGPADRGIVGRARCRVAKAVRGGRGRA